MFALILIGGICSGKTNLANRIMSSSVKYHLISKDQCIYESDMLERVGIKKSWDTIRLEHIIEHSGKNLVFDETIRVGKLDEIKRMGYVIIGIKMPLGKTLRYNRLMRRNKIRKKLMDELSMIARTDFEIIGQERRRQLWRSSDFINSFSPDERSHFDTILRNIYLLGSQIIKDEEPNPACFPQLDYIAEASDLNECDYMSPETIISKSVSYQEYLKQWASRIKYCVWDVGGVFYDFSLKPLYEWIADHSSNLYNLDGTIRKISFNEYMSGKITFEGFCQSLCETHGIVYRDEYKGEIEERLHHGVGEMFPETEEAISSLKKLGITNCVLSNALPALASDGNYPDLINPEHRFYSFELRSLKPANEIYIATRDGLGASFEEMIFVDDKERNVNSATDLGIYSIRYNRETILAELTKVFGPIFDTNNP